MVESEVAQLRKRIELEYQAMQRGLNGVAEVAKHNMVNHKYDSIYACYEQLESALGNSEQAAEMLIELNDKMVP
ncbi:hypothetical protein [Ktedonospora formicarum]|uniref:Uncharacterized protein n=1 Tax=Ktedonospora formicarum TaxID=2778364 RepID=A0A8J3HYZ4_9CHLR|nr:hypothetical protein [Ktedonospora formicarum]GHO44566.1 hypothetical protein KSX_27290 [Ktedonospora formicarum]